MEELKAVALALAIVDAGGNLELLLPVLKPRVPEDWDMVGLVRMVRSFKAENPTAFVEPRRVLVTKPITSTTMSFHRPVRTILPASKDGRSMIREWAEKLAAWLRPSGSHSDVPGESPVKSGPAETCAPVVKESAEPMARGIGNSSASGGSEDRVLLAPVCYTRTIVAVCKRGRMVDSIGTDYGVCPNCMGTLRGDFDQLAKASGI